MKKIFILQLTFAFALNSAVAQDSCIDFEWAVQHSSFLGRGYAIGVDAQGNSYTMIGPYLSIEKKNSQGMALWNTSLYADVTGWGMVVDASGNSYVTGSLSGTVSFGNITLTSSGQSIFIAKLNTNGQFLWAKNFETLDPNLSSKQAGYDIAVDHEGNCYVAGCYGGTTLFGGNIFLASNGYDNLFLTKLNTSGQIIWAKHIGSMVVYPSIYPPYLATDMDGNAYVTFRHDNNTVINKYDTDGEYLWGVVPTLQPTSSSNPYAYPRGIVADSVGNCYITGIYHRTSKFGSLALPENSGAFISKLSQDGTFMWVSAVYPSCDPYGGITMDKFGNSYITGKFSWSNTFGNNILTADNADVFVAKLNPNGQFIAAIKAGGNSDDYGFGIAVDVSENIYVTGQTQSSQSIFGNNTLIPNLENGINSFITKLSNCNEEVGIASLEASSIQIFPNPSSSFFTIADVPVGAMLSITDYTGKPVYNQLLMSEQTVVETSTFTNGIYFINITHNGIRTVEKLIINK